MRLGARMKNTDFVDGDLVARRGGAGDSLGRVVDGMNEEGAIPARSISDISLGRLTKHREEITTGVVSTINEIETLRRRQEELEQEKKDLEELGKKQAAYERGKREAIEHLNEGIIALEKKEVQSAQLTDLLVATRNRFKELLEEIESIHEDQWGDEDFRTELYKALVIVDDGRMEYNKALAKIQVLERRSDSILDKSYSVAAPAVPEGCGEKSFGQWVKIGFAVSLPFWILVILGIAGWASVLFFLRT